MSMSFTKRALPLALAMAIAGCDGGSSSSTPAVAVPAVNPAGDCPAFGNLNPIQLSSGECRVGGTLTEDVTLVPGTTWFLTDRLQVGTDANAVSLTLEAGTEIRGSGSDHVLVWPGSSLLANGTAESPVRMLSDDDDVAGRGEWGGLFIRGFNGLTNLSGTSATNSINHLVVAEAGAPVSVTIDSVTTNYQDNIVLNGLDENSTFRFVQSHNSARDGVHIVNGNPRLAWVLATGSARDGIWYRDFSGVIKDLMVIHDRDSDGSVGRAGIYASESEAGNSNPRIVNATLVGRDASSTAAGDDDREFGILFADNTDQIRLGNVLIANFRNGCYEVDGTADLSQIDTNVPGPNYLDGVHCANEAGANPMFGVVRAGGVNLPAETIAPNNAINANGLQYHNGANNPITFTGEIADRSQNFTSSWYLNNIGGIPNGHVADSTSLNAFLDGDTNSDRMINAEDVGSPFFMTDDGPGGFNQDVGQSGGYDLTHIGAVRGGAPSNAQFDGWTVGTSAGDGFVVPFNENLVGQSNCPATFGGANIQPLERSAGRNVCQISGTLIEDVTLTSDTEWQLEGRLQVGNNVSVAALNIASGTRISGDNVDAIDHLLVWPGSRINAMGTSARPVRLSSDDAGVEGSAEWGGLYLRGFNGIGLTGTQGANRLDYVVVSEAGASVDVTIDGTTVNYQDNVVLNGLDSTSTLTFVQSHNSARDGLHILNGDPRLSWILATGSGRDGVWYRNFSGVIKDLMVIHNRDADGSSGRAGIYASETAAGDSNPRIVNATLVGRDSESTVAGSTDREFGLLFADNTDQIRLANVIIANFRNGCLEAESSADLSAINTSIPGPNYLDGVHCLNEAGPNPANFAVFRDGAVPFPAGTIGANNTNGDGLIYYNGVGAALAGANVAFDADAGGLNLTGELVERGNDFTASWYVNNIRGIGNGLVGNPNFLNGFLDGDTNRDGLVDADDTQSPFFMADDGLGGFNQDVADDTFGYDLTHIGAVRGGAPSNDQFDDWTVGTLRSGGFTVRQ